MPDTPEAPAVLDERVTNLEIKLSYQEHTIETLNQVVLDQAAQIEALARRLDEALERQASEAEPGPGDPLDELPPHY